MRTAIPLVAAALCVGSISAARDAFALGPLDFEAGLKGGGGTPLFGGQPNALGFGLGARAGLSFLGGYYAGVNFMYYFGESGNVAAPAGPVSTSEHSVLYGIEGGYGIKLLDLLTIRGVLGIGNYQLSYTGIGSVNPSNFYLQPSLVALLGIGSFYIGGDIGALILPGMSDPNNPNASSTWATAMTADGQLGVRF